MRVICTIGWYVRLGKIIGLSTILWAGSLSHAGGPKEASNIQTDSNMDICENIAAPPLAFKDIPKDKIMIEAGDLVITYDSQVYWKEQFVKLKRQFNRANAPQPHLNPASAGNLPNNSSVILPRLLNFLADNRNRYVTQQEIFDEVWVHREVTDENLIDEANLIKFVIVSLRRSFQKVDPEFDQIKWRMGLGYVWDSGDRTGFRTIGDLWIHDGMVEVKWKGYKVDLNPSEFNIVTTLAKSPQTVFSQQRLHGLLYLDRSRDGSNVSNSIKVLVSRIRSKFLEVDPEFQYINNHFGEGYSWDRSK